MNFVRVCESLDGGRESGGGMGGMVIELTIGQERTTVATLV